jgi:hypothetical protein
VASPAPVDLILFVSGEPGPAENLSRDVVTSIGARLVGSVIPSTWFQRRGAAAQGPPRSPPPEGAEEWHVPRQEVSTVNLVVELAHDSGRAVTLVNVNGRGDQELTQRWVTVQDVLPMLVRPDGARLVGMEQFGPGSLREFLRAGGPHRRPATSS